VDFAESYENDRHFVCDSLTGDVYFGPSVRQPDGPTASMGQYSQGPHHRLFQLPLGGGLRGNVAAGQIEVLKSSIPYVAERHQSAPCRRRSRSGEP